MPPKEYELPVLCYVVVVNKGRYDLAPEALSSEVVSGESVELSDEDGA